MKQGEVKKHTISFRGAGVSSLFALKPRPNRTLKDVLFHVCATYDQQKSQQKVSSKQTKVSSRQT